MVKMRVESESKPYAYSQGKGKKLSLLLLGSVGGWQGFDRGQIVDLLTSEDEFDELEVALAGPGGAVWEGITIYNIIRSVSVPTTCYIIGECASASTIIAAAFDEVYMTPGSIFMVHEASTEAYGTKKDLKRGLNMLETVDKTIIEVYHRKTSYPIDKLQALVEAESWLTPQQTVELGFANGIVEDFKLDFANGKQPVKSDWLNFIFMQAAEAEARKKELVTSGFPQVKNYVISSIKQNPKSKTMGLVQKVIAAAKQQGLKFLNQDGQEVDDETLENALSKEIDVSAMISREVSTHFQENLEAIAQTVVVQLKNNPEPVAKALAASMEEALSPIAKQQVQEEIKGLRNEIAGLKAGASGRSVGQGSGVVPVAANGQKGKLKSGSANRGTSHTQLEMMLRQGLISQADFDELTKEK